MKSKTIAISAISASLIAGFLILGAFVDVLDISMVLVASIFVVMPISYGSYKGSLLAYLAGGCIAMLIAMSKVTTSGVFPAYFGYFGLFPIITAYMKDKKINKWIIIAVGVIWSIVACYGLYYFYLLILNFPVENIPWGLADYMVYIVGAVGVVFWLLFSRLLVLTRKFLHYYLNRIIKK